jgi:hypothetical protein
VGGQELIQCLGRGLPAESLAGAAVEGGSDSGQVAGGTPAGTSAAQPAIAVNDRDPATTAAAASASTAATG